MKTSPGNDNAEDASMMAEREEPPFLPFGSQQQRLHEGAPAYRTHVPGRPAHTSEPPGCEGLQQWSPGGKQFPPPSPSPETPGEVARKLQTVKHYQQPLLAGSRPTKLAPLVLPTLAELAGGSSNASTTPGGPVNTSEKEVALGARKTGSPAPATIPPPVAVPHHQGA